MPKNTYSTGGPVTDLGDLIDEVTGAHHGDMFRARPYDGQPHTDLGERGKQEVHGITMRDLRDCFIRAVALSSGPGPLYQEACKGERANISENDLYGVNWGEMDIIAVQQNLTCEVEQVMGIYPNVPKLRSVSEPPKTGARKSAQSVLTSTK